MPYFIEHDDGTRTYPVLFAPTVTSIEHVQYSNKRWSMVVHEACKSISPLIEGFENDASAEDMLASTIIDHMKVFRLVNNISNDDLNCPKLKGFIEEAARYQVKRGESTNPQNLVNKIRTRFDIHERMSPFIGHFRNLNYTIIQVLREEDITNTTEVVGKIIMMIVCNIIGLDDQTLDYGVPDPHAPGNA